MTDIEKARSMWGLLANVGLPLDHSTRCQVANVFANLIEQHEAYKREVSDAVEELAVCVYDDSSSIVRRYMGRFIIAKPDPLVEVISSALREGSPFNEDGSHDYTAEAKVIAAAIRASGLEVRKIGEGE